MPKVPFWVFIFIAILYFTATRVDIMDIDASQYAEISREMLQKGDYLHTFDRGHDYLDKPPFLFWMSAGSMKLFGVNAFGYKFPAIIFALWAIFATYRLTRLLYNDKLARMAALVFASCQGMFLWTNDVRCDTILTSCVITAIWLIQEWLSSRKLHHLLLGCAAIAFGMMTKGPIALMVPCFCFGADWILKREWRNFLKPAYLLGIIVIAVLLIPMSIGLYQQFDLHPEKFVDGKQGVSGLRFFYWTQSFGRITGESPWNNGADMGFLLLNMLWAFLPWIFLFVTALIVNSVQLVKQKFRLLPGQEWVTTGGFIITYLALGSSTYQLPHYIFVAFPLASIVTARLLWDIIEEGKYRAIGKFMKPFQITITTLLLLASLALITYVFPSSVLFVAGWVVCFAGWLYLAFRKQLIGKFFWLSASGIIIVNIFLTNHLYYTLLHYQVGSQIGRYIYKQAIPEKDIVTFKMEDPLNSLPFYAQEVIQKTDSIGGVVNRKYILTMDKGMDTLRQKGFVFDIEKQGVLYKVSELTPDFLNPATRSSALKNYYLLKVITAK